ncbi:uncharacterized protein LOC124359021 isoform X3 [Homalodisca vitripennis]|uniref:uncharacterized protein LOC124359021 isoform X3 n=1 Tax=Homalodisca vitripennis TaxID=197043 RepID=UPI001EEBCE7D|nr:uncharacterized protein LOC124359021 isoform X3 [Homalodisca vitripennis]
MADQGKGSEQSTSAESEHAKAVEFKNSGNHRYSKNDFKRAIADYKKGLLHEPNNSELHTNLSAAYIHLERYIEAEEHAVFAIQLRPNFYKGYMRAAKAAHGRCMTKLALKRITAGLAAVTDTHGIKELTRLKTQYTAYLSLAANAEQEINFDSEMYQSEDEDEEGDTDDEDALPPPASSIEVPVEPALAIEPMQTKVPEPSQAAIKDENSVKVEDPDPLKPEEPSDSTDPTSDAATVEDSKGTTSVPELEFKDLLKEGSGAFLSHNYRKAAECFKSARERVGKLTDFDIDDRQYNIIKYAHCAALVSSDSYDEIVKALQMLGEMHTYEFTIPALYIQTAKAYCKLNRFKSAQEPLDKLQEIIDNYVIFPSYTWPETNEIIQETTPNGLKDAIKELNQICRIPHKPTAICRYQNCLKISTHILPSELIHISDPDFVGFVRMICEEKCHIEFHISCWKAYKEYVSGLSRINDKEMVGTKCVTTDCINSAGEPSLITTIEVIGADGQVKSINKLDTKNSSKSIRKEKKKKTDKKDDKDKDQKSKKKKEKKKQDKKKAPHAPAVMEYNEDVGSKRSAEDTVMLMDKYREHLLDLRTLNFGLSNNNYWNPQLSFFGKSSETIKASLGTFLEDDSSDVSVRDAKEFIFSFFFQILTKEGPLKQRDVEDLWKDSDVNIVLPSVKSICDILLESTRFCRIEDYICLSDQIEDLYNTVKTEVAETFIMMNFDNPLKSASTPQTSSQLSSSLPDLISDNTQTAAMSSSEDETESDEDNSDESEESEDEDSEVEDSVEEKPSVVNDLHNIIRIEEEPIVRKLTEELYSMPGDLKINEFSVHELLQQFEQMKQHLKIKESIQEINETKKTYTIVNDDIPNVVKSSSVTANENATTSTITANENATTSTITANENATTSTITANENASTSTITANKNATTSTITANENATTSTITANENAITSTSEDQAPSEAVEVELLEDKSQEEIGEEVLSVNEDNGSNKTETPSVNTVEDSKKNNTLGSGDANVAVESSEHVECSRASQSEMSTKERHMQTSPPETRDKFSQTKEPDLYKELNKKIQDLNNQLAALSKETSNLSKQLTSKEATIARMEKSHKTTISHMEQEKQKILEFHRIFQENVKEQFSKNEMEIKRTKEGLVKSMRDMSSAHAVEIAMFKNEKESLLKEKAELKKSIADVVQEFESKYSTLQKNMKTMIQKAQHSHLQTIKSYWERQITSLKMRSIDKISEMQNWFSMFPPAEVEDLPSWGLIRQNTVQCRDFHNTIQQMEVNFQVKCDELEAKIARGEVVEDLATQLVLTLPDEPPPPLPLDKIHKEITEKYLKKITELNILVADQQLQIKKSKIANQQIQQIMNSFQVMSHLQTPTSSELGGLPFQYPYTQSVPPPPVPTIPPPSSDAAKVGSVSSLFFLPPDAQHLLSENSNSADFNKNTPVTQIDTASFSVPITTPPPVIMPESSQRMTAPPPPLGMAHELFKSITASTEKKDQTTPMPEAKTKISSSRESTPTPVSAPAPEKSKKKKKKKGKSESTEVVPEVRTATPVSVEPELSESDCYGGPSEWKVVIQKGAMKPAFTTPFVVPEVKTKNKKKLLDKLQMKFPTTPLKELDDIVKQVREKNNGSLSGLPFDEIETRVERLLTMRHFQKTSTMGLVKFSESAWGTVKHQDTINVKDLQCENCVICFEVLGKERTKLGCNHEFDTKCIRDWLKRKSVCPLCNEFTTMPDEFPAL